MRAGLGFRVGSWVTRVGRRGLAILVTTLLALPSLATAGPPGAGAPLAKGKGAALSAWPTAGVQSPAGKIDPSVSAAFKAQSQVTYMVSLHAKTDVKGAANAARNQASPGLKEVAARSAVMRALRDTAEVSQRSLLATLEQEKSRGSVSRFSPYWITNAVVVTSTQEVMHKIAKRSDVRKILPNMQIHLIGKTNQSSGGSKGTPKGPGINLMPTGPKATLQQPTAAPQGAPSTQSIEWNIERVGAPAVWSQYGIDGSGTVVAGLDTGTDWNHPALHDKWRGYDPSTGSSDPTYSWFDAVNGQAMPYDDHGHGTHTMGTAVGSEASGANQIGVAPGARWIHAKILSAAGSGTAENIIVAGQWLLAPGGDPAMAPDVVNNSWGGGPGIDEWFRDVVTAWRAAGIVPVFAAGNEGSGDGSVSVPGNYPESFAVGATDINDALASFSSRGPSPYGEIKPEVAAPGVNVRSSVPGGGYEGGWSGTSMAAPHVAGTVALLRAADASLTVDQIEQILMSSAEPKTDSRYTSVPNNGYGHGLLNAFTAVGMVVDGVGTVGGRVVTGGDDFDPPAIQHTPVTEAFKRMAVQIDTTVTDNVSVTAVHLRFRMPSMSWWGIVEMSRTAGDHKSGTYSGDIPADMTQGSAVEYYIEAIDYGGNSAFSGTARSPHQITLLDGLQPGYRMDFEGPATGWTHSGTNDPWQIGEPTSGPGSAHSGTRLTATNLSGAYPNGADAFLLSPPIDLSSGGAALKFWHWYDIEAGWDNAYVVATGDGGATWQILGQYTGAGRNWREVSLDLSAYAGNPAVFVAFYFVSDVSITLPGWYIDDIELYRDTHAPAAPANLTATATPAGSVSLAWDANTEADLQHYTVYRSDAAGGPYTAVGQSATPTYLDSTTASGATYYYVATATDIFDNESGYSAEASVSVGSVEVRFHDDMESGTGSWTHAGTGDPWQHGAPLSGPSAAHSGTSLWGTNLAGNYGNSVNASLQTPAIDLSGLSAASLQFAHWYSIERNWDYGYVEISTDGTSWTELARYTAPGTGGQPVGWEQPLIDLTAYVGQTVHIRFRLQSDSSVNYAGWYIDDVSVAGMPNSSTSLNRPLSSPEVKAEISLKGKAPQAGKLSLPPLSTKTKIKTEPAGSIKPSVIGIQSLPVSASVTVLETGRVVRTDPASGAFSLTLPAGTFTLRAESYGYYPADRSVTVTDGGHTSVVIPLTPIPRGTITGQVTDARTGNPIAGAQVSVAEDLQVAPATTDASGNYSLEVLEGAYTLQVRATGYYPASHAVTVPGNGSITQNASLSPFIGMPDEISYDDGAPENAWGFFQRGNGWGVRMSPDRPGATTVVTGGRFYLWDTSWPSPGGNTFQAAIYSANPDGTPGTLLAGPVQVTNAIRGGWNDVDFSGFGVAVTGDFYMVYIQDADNPNMPGLAIDETPPDAGRAWQMVSGVWEPWADGGNFLIRAQVSYAVGAPTITAPADGAFTNQAAATVTGTTAAGTTVTLYVNGTQAGEATPDAEGNWSATVSLTEGANQITATATVPGSGAGSGVTDPSAPITVTLDTAMPTLTVSSPTDGSSQGSRIITVTGSASDAHMGGVTVNGQAATLGNDGSFTHELIGQMGANTITVAARDLAGNETIVTRSVHVDDGAPTLSNMEPAADMTVSAGDTVTVAFDSEPGLSLAAFQIVLDTGGQGTSIKDVNSLTLQPGEIAMQEVSAGHYEGTWTVPQGFTARVRVAFRAVDAAGNATRATAPGAITVGEDSGGGGDEGEAPTAVISGPDGGRRGNRLTFSGTESSDPDGTIVSYEWDMGDGSTYTTATVRHRFQQAGTYTVTLTVTDDSGMTNTATHTVQIRNR